MKARRVQRAALAAGLVSFAGGLLACSAILGLPGEVTTLVADAGSDAASDAFANDATDAGADAGDARCATIPDPSYVFGTGDCQTCLASKCTAQNAACQGNAECRARIGCIAHCADKSCSGNDTFTPDCYDRCLLDFILEGAAISQNGSFLKCAGSSCRTECGLGTDFACVGGYTWPTPPTTDPLTLVYQIDYADMADVPVEAGTIAPCADGTGVCGATPPGVPVIANGVATVTLVPKDKFGNPAAWQGYFDIEGSKLGGIILYRNRPEWSSRPRDPRGERESIPVPSAVAVGEAYLTDPLPQDAGTVVGAIEDCRGILNVFAEGIVVNGDVDGGIDINYLGLGNLPDTSLHATGSQGQFLIKNMPSGFHTFVFTFADGGAEYSRVTTVVERKKTTQFGIWPAPKK